MVAVPGFPRARYRGRPHLLLLGRGFQMRIEQRYLGIELGLDLCQLDFGLGLDLLMNGVFCAFCCSICTLCAAAA
jgi:hypothetical protein